MIDRLYYKAAEQLAEYPTWGYGHPYSACDAIRIVIGNTTGYAADFDHELVYKFNLIMYPHDEVPRYNYALGYLEDSTLTYEQQLNRRLLALLFMDAMEQEEK